MFAASVISLSWFFAGWRQVNEHGGIADWGVLAGGTAATLLLLSVQGYWIYFDEKGKGNLTKTVKLFDQIDKFLQDRKSAKSSKNDSNNPGGRQ